jgi:sorting nexin-4
LKLRDQKQVDYEELTEYLAATEKERERTMHPSMMDRGLNITGYLTDRIQEARGIDSEKMRREKILKLDMRIREVSHNPQYVLAFLSLITLLIIAARGNSAK